MLLSKSQATLTFGLMLARHTKPQLPKSWCWASHTTLHLTENETEALKHDTEHWCTQEVVKEDYLPNIRPDGTHGNNWIRAFRYTATMITGGEYSSSDQIWQKLAFYNFIQKQAGFSSADKTRVDEAALDMSRKAFFEVLAILKPDLVIAWGTGKLYEDFMPQDAFTEIPGATALYKYDSFPDAAIWHINHPSHGFSYETWSADFIKVCNILNLPLLTI